MMDKNLAGSLSNSDQSIFFSVFFNFILLKEFEYHMFNIVTSRNLHDDDGLMSYDITLTWLTTPKIRWNVHAMYILKGNLVYIKSGYSVQVTYFSEYIKLLLNSLTKGVWMFFPRGERRKCLGDVLWIFSDIPKQLAVLVVNTQNIWFKKLKIID